MPDLLKPEPMMIFGLFAIILLLSTALALFIRRLPISLNKKRLYFTFGGAFFMSPTILPAGIAGLIVPSPLGFPATIYFSFSIISDEISRTYTKFGLPDPDANHLALALTTAIKILWIWGIFFIGYAIAALALYLISKKIFVSKDLASR